MGRINDSSLNVWNAHVRPNTRSKFASIVFVGILIFSVWAMKVLQDKNTALSDQLKTTLDTISGAQEKNRALSEQLKTTLDTISGAQEKNRALSEQLNAMTKKYSDLLQQTKSSTAIPVVDTAKLFVDALVASESDKYFRHHYEHYYVHWLSPFRDVPKFKLLEIGADYGKSLLLWSTYFTHPELILGLAYGEAAKSIDQIVNEKQESGTMREIVQVVKGDQSKEETMETLRKMGPYHIIVDDGSHVPDHISFSLFSLWNSVEPGGLYIVEDLECNYWHDGASVYGYPLHGTGVGTSPKDNAVEKIKQLIDTLVKNQIGATKEDMSIMPGDETICSIEFGKNLVALKKCTEAEMASAPTLLSVIYDKSQMEEWVQKAKSTNPVGFK